MSVDAYPPLAVSETSGNQARRATPARASAACIASWAEATSGRRASTVLGTPAGTPGSAPFQSAGASANCVGNSPSSTASACSCSARSRSSASACEFVAATSACTRARSSSATSPAW